MFNSRRLALLRKLPRAPFHPQMSGKYAGHSNMMLFWRQRWQAAMPGVNQQSVLDDCRQCLFIL
jgi:hypothetical protein